MQPVPVNVAEAVIDPLWNPKLSEADAWSVTGSAKGIHARQNWCNWVVEWGGAASAASAGAAGEAAVRLEREFGVPVGAWERLLVSLQLPVGARLRLTAATDAGPRTRTTDPAGERREEAALELEGAARLDRLILEILPGDAGAAVGHLNWVGLQSPARLEAERARHRGRAAMVDRLLVDRAYEPAFRPAHDLLLDAAQLEALRERHPQGLGALEDPPAPEPMIGAYVNFWSDTRYCRVRDEARPLVSQAVPIALDGLLRRDPERLRLAARYALSIALCEHWDDGFVTCFPGSDWEHRSFVPSLCTFDVAAVLELAGEMFNEAGRSFLRRALAERGLGNIRYVSWRYDYIHHCNQLLWFSPARMLALAVLEKCWPRVGRDTDRAFEEAMESVEATILPDGGYVEGPMYLKFPIVDGGQCLWIYSRLRGRPIAEMTPPALARTGDFYEALASTVEGRDVIPLSDAQGGQVGLLARVMRRLAPGTAWDRLAAAQSEPAGGKHGWLDAALSLECAGDASPPPPPPAPPPRPHLHLAETRLAASYRMLEGEPVKLLVVGGPARAGHQHEDKGHFVLEAAGEALAEDPGVVPYDHALCQQTKWAQRHNMLIPTGLDQRAAPENPVSSAVEIESAGDAATFTATVEAGVAWPDLYERWQRRIESPAPDRLDIHDTWSLARGDGVSFLWQTFLPAAIEGETVVITGRRARVRIAVPEGAEPRIERLPWLEGATQQRVSFTRPGRSGAMTVRVRIERRAS